jgi:hypothetical protein
MKDPMYIILRKIAYHKDGLRKEQILRLTTSVYSLDYLLYEKYISSGCNEDGDPDGFYYIEKRGLTYIIDKDNEKRIFWRNFFSQFITGLITGSVGTVVLKRIIVILLSGKP